MTNSIPNDSPESLGTENLQNGPSGLGGWLVLVALGLVVFPFRIGAFLLLYTVPIFTDGTWEILTTPGSDQYHALWAPLLIVGVFGNVGFVIADIALVILIFSKSRLFPKAYIAFSLIQLCFILLDAWLSTFAMPDESMLTPGLVGTLVSVAIWVPYMMVSKRVRNTFV